MNVLKFLSVDPAAILPTRGSPNAAGLDLCSIENVRIDGRNRAAVRTGLCVALPEGCYGRIAPRSGLALKSGIDVLAGVVDSDYRGEIICILINHSEKEFSIKVGDRVAQFILEKILIPAAAWTDELEKTSRSDRGFGSTGD